MITQIQTGLSDFITNIATFIAVIAELVGVIIIVIAIVKYLYRAIAVHKLSVEKIHEDKSFNIALSVALEVLLASEILKTLSINGNFDNLLEVVLLIVVRILMAVVLRFEKKS